MPRSSILLPLPIANAVLLQLALATPTRKLPIAPPPTLRRADPL
jgi:hypothetical protein